ncbi:MAG: alpha/beta fold hydrolase [Deltaproteobacteria bacterium]|jgi:dienelactone hydrolase|nr:alpha/beta fold hydrolase [Deltaproteobacteria bacterium]MBW2537491.1 alpha/beta fold hydrolase [Deltaproteobacteria bacterium]
MSPNESSAGNDSVPAAQPARTTPSRGTVGWGGKIVIALGVLFVVVGGVLVTTSMWPIDPASVSQDFPARVKRNPAAPVAAACGLTEQRTGDGCVPARPDAVREEEVSFPSRLTERGIEKLVGTLSLPQGLDGPRPGVVLIHGSGPNTRDSPSPGDLILKLDPPFPVLQALANVLSQQGLVVLRYDKRSCAKCYPGAKLDAAGFSFEHFEIDARDAVAYLRTRSEVDPRAIVIAGHSQGGQYAPFVAHQDSGVAAVIMLAGTTQTFEQGLIGQLRRLEEIRWGQLDPLGALQIAGQRRKFQRCFDKLRGDYDPQEQCLGGGVTLRALAEYQEYAAKTVARIGALRCPLLALFGSVDRNIDPAVADEVERALEGKPGEVHVIAGMAHSLTNAVRPSTPTELDPGLVEALTTFLRAVRVRPAPPGDAG